MDSTEQAIFRFFIATQVCNKELVSKVFLKMSDNTDDAEPSLPQCLESINSIIKNYNLEIVEGNSDVTGDTYIALVQVCESGVADLAKFDEKKAKLLFAKLISTITLSHSGFLSETSCINLGRAVDMSTTNTQNAIHEFLNQGWLEEKDGNIYIGVRSILEIGQLLASTYPDNVKICSLCKKNVFHGLICSLCQAKMHCYCLRKYFERTKTCPSCSKEWSQYISSPEDQQSQQTPRPSYPKRPRLISDSD